MKNARVQQWGLGVLAAVFWIVSAVEVGQAKTLNVANNGLDSATCGDKKNPCRSISQAIINASAGDKIIVGPGRYGDLNGNGTFGEAGEENAEIGSGCFCMIKVNKQLTIESRDGAAATVLDAGLAGVDVVLIEPSASGTVFGKKKKGFTLTRGGINGLDIADGTVGVKVAGNLATVNGNKGFRVDGSGHVLTGNLASLNNQLGFSISGNGHVLSSNVANANGAGFLISSNSSNGHLVSGNIANANDAKGFIIDGGSGHVLTGNSALGNKDFGIEVLDGSSATITKNNIFGNNSVSSEGITNCGLINRSKNLISATNNFWGVASGPGTLTTPKDEPADNVCDDPGAPGSSTTVEPFATKEFKVKVKILDEIPGDTIPAESNLDDGEAKHLWMREEARVQLLDLGGHLKYDSGWQASSLFNPSQLSQKLPGLANGVYLYMLRGRDREGKEVHREVKRLIIER